MPRLGFALPDELKGVPLSRTVELAQVAEQRGFDSVWKGETSGSNGFMVLSAVAQSTDRVRLGTGIANVFSRSPTLLGMSTVTLDELSGGRAVLGLGVSSNPIVESWHGMEYDRPLRRTRETIEILHQCFEGGRVEYDGEIFDIGPYTMELELDRSSVPIYNAAMGATNRKLTGEYADGWLPVFIPLSRLEGHATEVRTAGVDRGRPEDDVAMVPWVVTAVSADRDRAERLARDHLAQEMGMGYNRIAAEYGFGTAADKAAEQWRDGDRDAAAAAISEEMLEELTIHGTPADCKERIEAFADAGADEIVLWPPFTATDDEVMAILNKLGSDGGDGAY